jgi:hypothetical protein
MHRLIESIPDDEIEEVVVILSEFVEKKEAGSLFSELIKNSIKIQVKLRFSRADLYEG